MQGHAAHARLVPRPEQREAADVAIQKNTIVNMDTGRGKTLVAVLVMEHFLSTRPQQRVLFVVPTRALVGQQAAYIREHCHPPGMQATVTVAELSGQVMDTWTQDKWQETLSLNRVLVGTAEVFRKALVDTGHLAPSRFSLLVLDECHNAVGNSPMVGMLTDSITRAELQHQPRILGLTASFANGSLKNLQAKRAKMEALLMANIISPVAAAPDSQGVADSNGNGVDDGSGNEEGSSHGSGADGSGKRYHTVPVPFEDLEPYSADVIGTVASALADAPQILIMRDEVAKWTTRGWNIFAALGWEGFRFWLREGIVKGLRAHAEELEQRPEAATRQKATAMKAALTQLSEQLKQCAAGPSAFDIACSGDEVYRGLPSQPPYFSQKVMCLANLLLHLKAENGNQGGPGAPGVADARGQQAPGSQERFRGLVFVELTAMTYPVAFLLNKFLAYDTSGGGGTGGLSALPVSGISSMTEGDRNAHLGAFRRGDVPLLVATAALEEGIDVPQCSFVVRFDKFNTTRAHIQGSGRARSLGAVVYYFENDQAQECGAAAYLRTVAGDTSLNLSLEEMERQRAQRQHMTPAAMLPDNNLQFVYPFRRAGGPDGEVNFFNCLTIVYEYVQAVMKQSFDPEAALFQVREETVRELPAESTRVIMSVTWPTPRGEQRTSAELVHRMWAGRSVESVVRAPDRLKKMSGWDRDKRRALYVVVLQMHALGLLDASNQATADARDRCRHACPTYRVPNRLAVKVAFAKTSLYQ